MTFYDLKNQMVATGKSYDLPMIERAYDLAERFVSAAERYAEKWR